MLSHSLFLLRLLLLLLFGFQLPNEEIVEGVAVLALEGVVVLVLEGVTVEVVKDVMLEVVEGLQVIGCCTCGTCGNPSPLTYSKDSAEFYNRKFRRVYACIVRLHMVKGRQFLDC